MALLGLLAGGAALLLGLPGQVEVRASAEERTLPATTVVCVATAGAASTAAVRQGQCPSPTRRVPADVWLRLDVAADAIDAVLISTDLYAIKFGELEVFIDGAPPVLVRARDPLAVRPYYDGRLAVPIRTAADRTTSVLARIRVVDQRQLARPERNLLLLRADAAQHAQAGRWFWQGVFVGLMLIMALYHAFLWRAERLAAAAWYSLTLIATTAYFAGGRHLFLLLPWSWVPQLALLLHPSEGPLMGVFFAQFARHYARLPPRSDAILRGLTVPLLLMTVLAPLVHGTLSVAAISTVVNVLGGVTILFLVGLSAHSALRGDYAAKVLAWSALAPAVGVGVQIGSMSGVLPSHGWPTEAMQLGLSLQVILLGLALSDRIRRLRIDRDQAEAIVRLTLPDVIADRLKSGASSIADRHDQVAVLFADLAGFTPLSASHEPEIIVRLLDALFSEMDALAHRVGAEKIKTIGDCYMVVAGAPSPHADPVGALAELALALPQAAARVLDRVRAQAPQLPAQLPLRVGLHVGPVIAGVLGKQKLAYDLWGDTVNTASRMESHGVIGRVQCTEQVVAALADRYEFEERGEIAVRGKGALKVWFLLGRRPAPLLAAPHEAGSGQRGR